MKGFKEILDLLPYKKPFLFVDTIESLNENGITGTYQLKEDEYFYAGHFPENPVTPGVIVIEIMAQIGLVCLGVHLFRSEINGPANCYPVFTSSKVDFIGMVRPGDKLLVNSKKIYYRFHKLKCEIECENLTTGTMVCKGEFSGMIVKKEDFEGK